MPLDAGRRRAFIAASHALKAKVTLSADNWSDASVAHVRAAFGKQELLKVRVQADSRDETNAVGVRLAAAVPCEIVTQIGRVLLLYRAEAIEETAAKEHG